MLYKFQCMDFATLILMNEISVVWKEKKILGKIKYLRAIHNEQTEKLLGFDSYK